MDDFDATIVAVNAGTRLGRRPGTPGVITKEYNYVCSVCGNEFERSELFVRQVTFINVATKKRERTRSIDWFCRACMMSHAEYQRIKYSDSPGYSA